LVCRNVFLTVGVEQRPWRGRVSWRLLFGRWRLSLGRPDEGRRERAVRSVLMEALAKEGVPLVITPAGRRRRHRSKIPMALVRNLVTRIQEIAFTGSDGDVLRLVFGMHEVFQPGKHERNGDTPRPRPATFVVAPATPATEEPSQVPAHPIAPGTLVDANGQEYVG
jgi:hypothetical protein